MAIKSKIAGLAKEANAFFPFPETLNNKLNGESIASKINVKIFILPYLPS